MSKEDTQHTIGKLHQGAHERDAIHVAVMSVVAAEALKPGQHIGFTEHGYRVTAKPTGGYKLIGIVDPFLPNGGVLEGDRFWMMLYPNTITGLKHLWSHPDIANDGRGTASSSERWLRDFADRVDADYDEMMRVAASHCDPDERWGDYLIEGGKWEGQSTPEEFWTHFAAVTGKTPTDGPTGIFSCSC